MSEPKVNFELKTITVPLDHILPVRHVKDAGKRVTRYRAIVASIKDAGMIEPLIVFPQKGRAGFYSLMDGHLRYEALKELGTASAICLIATDDESFTFNARINRLSPIQEHAMITKAVQNGVSAERIATALNLKIKDVQASLRLLDGIHSEAADLLKDKPICPQALRNFKKVSPVRQIEMAELMVSANNFTHAYASALLMGTPKDQLLECEKAKSKALTPEEVARLQHELESLERDFKSTGEAYGENVLNLTLIRAYLKKLIENTKIARFLSSRYSEIFAEFDSMIRTETL